MNTGVMGGEPQLDQSRMELSMDSFPGLAPANPSKPENMGFKGISSTSKFLGLPTALLDVDNGGVRGKYGLSVQSVSSMMAGLWLVEGTVAVGVMTAVVLLPCNVDDEEPGRE